MYTSNEFRVFLVIFALMAIFVAANMRGIFSKSDRVDSVKIEEGTPTKGVEVEWVGIDKSFYDSPVQPKDTSKTVNVDPDGMTAKSYIVGNAQTGQVYFESKGNLTLPIASMSKLMTAFVGKRVMTGTTTVEITAENIKVFPDQSRLEAGEKFTFDEILYPLLLNSSNVAAEAIATSYGRTEFLELMSSYAWEIGLPTSYFGRRH